MATLSTQPAAARSASTTDHLRIHGVSKRYDGQDVLAVDKVSLGVERGEFFGLLGPSGCGKTTTLNMIAGFVGPTEGEIHLGDRRLDTLPAHQRGTSMVFQDYGLFPHLTAKQNVAYGPKLRGIKGRALDQKVAHLLDLVGLGPHSDRLPSELSGGQRQRIAIARALATDPEIVLLDEPLSNLDERLRGQVRAELNRILRAAGVTVVLVTHDQSEAFTMCDRVAVMLGGQLHQVGPPHELYHAAATYEVASFVGESNMIPARTTAPGSESKATRLEMSLGGVAVHCGARLASTAEAGVEGLLQLRPEWLRLADLDAAGSDPRVEGVVAERIFQGVFVEYTVQLADRSVMARVLSNQLLREPGEAVVVTWDDDAGRFFPGAKPGAEPSEAEVAAGVQP